MLDIEKVILHEQHLAMMDLVHLFVDYSMSNISRVASFPDTVGEPEDPGCLVHAGRKFAMTTAPAKFPLPATKPHSLHRPSGRPAV
jgi:hypothetical protein